MELIKCFLWLLSPCPGYSFLLNVTSSYLTSLPKNGRQIVSYNFDIDRQLDAFVASMEQKFTARELELKMIMNKYIDRLDDTATELNTVKATLAQSKQKEVELTTQLSWLAANNSKLHAMVKQMEKNCQAIMTEVNVLEGNYTCRPASRSAFTVWYPVAGLTNGTIRFKEEITNIGNDYNTTTGQFVCRIPGIYGFALHLLKESGNSYVFCRIRKNQSATVRAYSYPSRWSKGGTYSSSTSVALHLTRGDVVDLANCSPIDSINVGTGTSFSGFLLAKD